MGEFNRGSKFGGGGRSGGGRSGGGGGRGGSRFGGGGGRSFGGRDSRGSGRPMMHKAVCSKCDSPCEVPFMPSGDKPVYCSDCYEKPESTRRTSGRDYTRSDSEDTAGRYGSRDNDRSERGGYGRDFNDSPRRSSGRDFGRSDFEDKQMFSATCDECGERCEVPFKPTAGKPVFCDSCFTEKGGNAGVKGADQNKQQFETINIKLDRILKFLAPFMQNNAGGKKADVTSESKKDGKHDKAEKKIEAAVEMIKEIKPTKTDKKTEEVVMESESEEKPAKTAKKAVKAKATAKKKKD